MNAAALLTLIAAMLFAASAQFSRLGLRTLNSREAALVQIGACAAVYWLFAPLFIKASYWLTWAVAMYVVAGFLRPFISVNLTLAGTRHLGPTLSSTLTCTAPVFGVGLGVLALDEPLTWQVWSGLSGVVVAVVVLATRGPAHGRPRTFPVWALALPVGAAAVRAIGHLIVKLGLEIVPSPFLVGLVCYTVGFAIAFAVSGRRGALLRASRTEGSGWMVLAGIMSALAVLVLNYALSMGRLSVVSPLLACTPMFALGLGWLVFRERELTVRSAVAVAIVVPSVALISA